MSTSHCLKPESPALSNNGSVRLPGPVVERELSVDHSP